MTKGTVGGSFLISDQAFNSLKKIRKGKFPKKKIKKYNGASPHDEIHQVLIDLRLEMATKNDEAAIDAFDFWLGEFLHRRDWCPNCGTKE